jgi:hypothetical protein
LRGNFDAIPGTNSLRDRLSSEGWQACSSCHFKGLTDGVIWQFAAGPRKSLPLNATFNPHKRSEQRLLNYSAIFDEVEDFEINIRNVSGRLASRIMDNRLRVSSSARCRMAARRDSTVCSSSIPAGVYLACSSARRTSSLVNHAGRNLSSAKTMWARS